MTALIVGLTGLGAVISLVLWLAAGWMVRPLVSGDRILDQDDLPDGHRPGRAGSVDRCGRPAPRLVPTEVLRLVLSALMGLQVVAAMSAVLFVRQVRMEAR